MSIKMSKGTRFCHNSKTKCTVSVTLERVLGFTAVNNCSVAFDSKNSCIYYTAGCVIVAESCDSNKQFIIQSPTRKSICCLDVSHDGKYIVTGESGHHPMVRIWSRADGRQIGELGSHHFRISSVRFSPVSATHIVSVGCQEDQTICVWDRVQLRKVASAKVSARVNAVAFNDDGEFFVTVGIRHVRFWYIDLKSRPKVKETQPLKGRNAVLGDMLHNTFTDVCCAKPEDPLRKASGDHQALTLVLSQTGQLLQINESRCVTKWVDLKVSNAGCMAVCGQTVAVGCSSGVCLLFSAISLRFIARVPLPHPLGTSIFSPNSQIPSFATPSSGDSEEPRYAEVTALKLDVASGHLICMYTDHSLYCWDVTNLRSISRRFAHFYHSRPVCCIAVTSLLPGSASDVTDVGRWGAPGSAGPPAHVEMFATCSDDDTVRLWSFPVNKSTLKCNELFSNGMEDVSILYTDSSYTNLCSDDRTSSGFGPTYFGQGSSTLNLSAPGSPALVRSGSSRWNSNVNIVAAVASQGPVGFGLRCVAISPDGRHLAVGDRAGQLRIYDFNSFKLLHSIRAHDAEILSISYFDSKQIPGMSLLCTSSRDRVIHVFAPRQDYSRVQTLADHSGIVNSALFVECEENRKIYLISCGADRSLLFRTLTLDPESQTARFVIDHHISVTHSYACATVVGPSAPNLDATSLNATAPSRLRQYLAVACQDRQMRLYRVNKARQLFNYRASTSEDGAPVCCAADPTSTLVATAGSDKQINLFHLFTGEHIATLNGHADVVMSLLFLPDLRHLVSVSCDSCVFVWRLAPELTALMIDRQLRVAAALPARAPSLEASPTNECLSSADPLTSASVGENLKASTRTFCYNENDLPSWAREKHLSESDTESSDCHTVPGRKVKRSLTGSLTPAPVRTHNVARSNSERSKLKLTTKRQRNRTIGASRCGSLGRGCTYLGHRSSSVCTDEDSDSAAMTSSGTFPRWASSAVNLAEASPFEPPVAKDDQTIPLREPTSCPQNLGPSTESSTTGADRLNELQINSLQGGRPSFDDYHTKLSRVEEICDNELEKMVIGEPGRPSSARASWLESDTGDAATPFCGPSENHGAALGHRPLIRRRLQEERPFAVSDDPKSVASKDLNSGHGERDSLSETDDNSSSNLSTSTSDSQSALNFLSNVREALDAAADHLASINDKNVVSLSREFFLTELDWRVARLRSILHMEAAFSSASSNVLRSEDPSQLAVAKLVERIMPSIRSAVAETLTPGTGDGNDHMSPRAGAMELSVELLPAD
uniref:ANAPC4_WD40 domain-containing protein n=1 Tax=Mesocestoides corti TaxID=53468 RepID=A0A5K3ETA8_MESCO